MTNELLDDSQLNRLSEILADAGQVFLATMVLSPFVAGLDKIDALIVTSGVIASLTFFVFSLALARDLKHGK